MEEIYMIGNAIIKMRSTEKECRECGERIKEEVESALYECERCIGRHEE